jgi:ribosomal protein S18 acetylase RimI-like enzyme
MTGKDRLPARTLAPDDVPEVVDVLCESFFDYPVMRHILGTGDDYAARLARLMTFFTRARVLRGEALLGVGVSDDPSALGAAALVSYPGARQNPPELDGLREVARSRYEAFGAACAPFEREAPHLHLNMIGTRRAALGRGLGRTLLEAVHGLSAADAASTGVSLTTEVEANVALYRHFGYEVVGTVEVVPGLTTWGFFRADPA